MNTKHTPGPWEVNDRRKEMGAVYVMADRNFIRVFNEWQDKDNHMANARLIAAAPELLDELIGADAVLEMEGYAENGPVRSTIRAAIAKATGSAS